MKAIDHKFKPLEQAVSKRKVSLKDAVKVGTRRKKDTIETQITKLEDNETCAAAAVVLSTETLEVGSKTQILQFKQMLLLGLEQLQMNAAALALPVGPGFDVSEGDVFKQALALIPSAGVAASGDSDPRLCVVDGEGLCATKGVRAAFKANFLLRTFDFGSGIPRTSGGDNIVVRFVMLRGDELELEPEPEPEPESEPEPEHAEPKPDASGGGGGASASANASVSASASAYNNFNYTEYPNYGTAVSKAHAASSSSKQKAAGEEAVGDEVLGVGPTTTSNPTQAEAAVGTEGGADGERNEQSAYQVMSGGSEKEIATATAKAEAITTAAAAAAAGKRKRGAKATAIAEQTQAVKKAKSSGGGGGGGSAGSRDVVTAPAAGFISHVDGVVVDNANGTYNCSYTPPDGAAVVNGGRWRLEVTLNGNHIARSPFPIRVHPGGSDTQKLAFGSTPSDGSYELTEEGSVVTKIKGINFKGVLADGPGCAPMNSGACYWELEVVKNDDNGHWYFGVCRPGIDLNDSTNFYSRDDTWLMGQSNTPEWRLYCTTCEGTGLTITDRQMPASSRVGLLLDLDNGGTLTMYLDNKPCGTIASGLVGPLVPCISSLWQDKVVKIHGGLAVPRQAVRNKWVFNTMKAGNYDLSEDGTAVSKANAGWTGGAIADGPGCSPMTSGKHYWELEVIGEGGGDGYWMFGVCRPSIKVNTAEYFRDRYETWLMWHNDAPLWTMDCKTCAGSGLTVPKCKLPLGSRVGLLLDLDNGGTLTMYMENKPCGTIAEGLVGPLVPCISSCYKGKGVKIHSDIEMPAITLE